MNILPKKSWHVLSKDNILRVRRDEANARAEEEEKASRAALAEQETRLGVMRKRARERDGMAEEEERGGGGGGGGGGGWRGTAKKNKREEVTVTDTSGHINFFTDLQKGVGLQVGNVEREKEMKQDQEKLEKRIGLLNYLVDKDKSDTPWYVRGSQPTTSSSAAGATAVETEEVEAKRKSAKAQHRKELQDPLLEMKGYLETKRKREKEEVATSGTVRGAVTSLIQNDRQSASKSDRRRTERTDTSSSGSDDDSRGHRHHHRHKSSHRHKKKEKKKKREEGERKKQHKKKDKEKEDELERLRRERRKREEGERNRSEALIRGLQGGDGVSKPQTVEVAPSRYNSQFNPHLARQH